MATILRLVIMRRPEDNHKFAQAVSLLGPGMGQHDPSAQPDKGWFHEENPLQSMELYRGVVAGNANAGAAGKTEPKPELLKLSGDWKQAVKKSLQKKTQRKARRSRHKGKTLWQ